MESLGITFPILPISSRTVAEALRGVDRHQFSYWDALIWATAKLNQIDVILTEDVPGGRDVLEGVRYLNPFALDFDLTRIGRDA